MKKKFFALAFFLLLFSSASASALRNPFEGSIDVNEEAGCLIEFESPVTELPEPVEGKSFLKVVEIPADSVCVAESSVIKVADGFSSSLPNTLVRLSIKGMLKNAPEKDLVFDESIGEIFLEGGIIETKNDEAYLKWDEVSGLWGNANERNCSGCYGGTAQNISFNAPLIVEGGGSILANGADGKAGRGIGTKSRRAGDGGHGGFGGKISFNEKVEVRSGDFTVNSFGGNGGHGADDGASEGDSKNGGGYGGFGGKAGEIVFGGSLIVSGETMFVSSKGGSGGNGGNGANQTKGHANDDGGHAGSAGFGGDVTVIGSLELVADASALIILSDGGAGGTGGKEGGGGHATNGGNGGNGGDAGQIQIKSIENPVGAKISFSSFGGEKGLAALKYEGKLGKYAVDGVDGESKGILLTSFSGAAPKLVRAKNFELKDSSREQELRFPHETVFELEESLLMDTCKFSAGSTVLVKAKKRFKTFKGPGREDYPRIVEEIPFERTASLTSGDPISETSYFGFDKDFLVSYLREPSCIGLEYFSGSLPFTAFVRGSSSNELISAELKVEIFDPEGNSAVKSFDGGIFTEEGKPLFTKLEFVAEDKLQWHKIYLARVQVSDGVNTENFEFYFYTWKKQGLGGA